MDVTRRSPVDFFRELRQNVAARPELAAVQEVAELTRDEPEGEVEARERIRAMALATADGNSAPVRGMRREIISYYTGHPIRSWPEVMWALEMGTLVPRESVPLLRTVVASVRLGIRGQVPALAKLAGWGDATDVLLPRITDLVTSLFGHRNQIGLTLYRQLVKSLPHLGGQSTELYDVRSAAEDLQWLVDCPLTLDIREEIHSRASPANLVLVRAYLHYLESGDTSELASLWMAQKIPGHDEKLEEFRDAEQRKQKLINTARELESILSRIYGFDASDPALVMQELIVWMSVAAEDVPGEAHEVVAAYEQGKCKEAAGALAVAREQLSASIDRAGSSAQSLQLMYLDLALEKLGYVVFGDVVNGDLAEITESNLLYAIDALRSMLVSENIKGHGTEKLRSVATALGQLELGPTARLAQLMALNHQVTDEIAEIGTQQYREYHDIVRSVLADSAARDVEVVANKFVDDLIRGTTLQHLGELSLRLYHYVLGRLEKAGADKAEQVRALVEKYHRQYESRSASSEQPSPMLFLEFGEGLSTEGSPGPEILGGKGANLCAMSRMGIPVPPGFIVSMGVCERYMQIHALEPSVHDRIREKMQWLEQHTGKTFGSPGDPLLVSVRSGAPVSMPGMLDTILNVGMTDDVADGLARHLDSEQTARSLYARFLSGFAGSVLMLDCGPPHDETGHARVDEIKLQVLDSGMEPFWLDVGGQVELAVEAVFRSWNNPHAVLFRKTHLMPVVGCTAATVQQMVLGNADDASCTGVLFTREPTTGRPGLFGEYLPRAQGEDIVLGERTPCPVFAGGDDDCDALATRQPEVAAQLREIAARLEKHFGTPQDIEFTVESGRLFVLQTRELQFKEQAHGTATAEQPVYRVIARGLGASPGGCLAQIAFSTDAARHLSEKGPVLFVRPSTTPDDLDGMIASDAVLTARGGVTSHAANNARHLGKACVTGCRDLQIDEAGGTLTIREHVFREGDMLFIDGLSGEVGIPE